MPQAIPPAAISQPPPGREGKATLRCTVTVEGKLRDCRVLSEDPPGVHFGEAALKVAATVTVKPFVSHGHSVEGTVNLPIRFVLGEDAKPARSVSPPLPSTSR